MIISVSPLVLPIDDDTQRRPNSVSQAGPLRVEKPTSRMSALGAQSGRLQNSHVSQPSADGVAKVEIERHRKSRKS
jgi:hypothetical protein